MEPESERSSNHNISNYRKDSKDVGMDMSSNTSHHFQPLPKKESNHKVDGH